ncbi:MULTISPECIES: YdaS family helix-turn-helix protein [Sphingomonas]|nr:MULTISPECIES: YdaS family helix-turn-helix protein [Sphingomonas]
MELSLDTPLARAVRVAGSQSSFGRMIGRRQSTVNHWLKYNRPLPAEHVLRVEELTGVSRTLLRPDIYPEGLDVPRPLLRVACDPSLASNAYHFSDNPAGRTAAEAPAALADRSPISSLSAQVRA